MPTIDEQVAAIKAELQGLMDELNNDVSAPRLQEIVKIIEAKTEEMKELFRQKEGL